MSKRIYLGFEYAFLFFGIPLYLYFFPELVFRPIAFLLPVVALIFFYLLRSPDFKWRELIRLHVSRKLWLINLAILFTVGILMILAVYCFDRVNLFNLPRMNTRLWLMLCVFYPIFSASIQEVIFKSFFFRRYAALFGNRILIIIGSGLAFSFIHIVYYSLVSLLLTLVMGVYLAFLYDKTKSVLFVTILHGIFGIMAFSFGLGQHFWLDMFEYIRTF